MNLLKDQTFCVLREWNVADDLFCDKFNLHLAIRQTKFDTITWLKDGVNIFFGDEVRVRLVVLGESVNVCTVYVSLFICLA